MMNKFIFGLVLAVTSTATFANSNVYVQADVLPAKLDMTGDDVGEVFKTKFNRTGFRLAVGQDTGAVRYQGDYSFLGQKKWADEEGNGKFNIQSVGFSVIYDFDTQSALTPYVGARAGVNVLNFKANSETESESLRFTRVGAGVLGGVQYNFTPQIAANAGLEYSYLGKFDGLKVKHYGANLGLRYNF